MLRLTFIKLLTFSSLSSYSHKPAEGYLSNGEKSALKTDEKNTTNRCWRHLFGLVSYLPLSGYRVNQKRVEKISSNTFLGATFKFI